MARVAFRTVSLLAALCLLGLAWAIRVEIDTGDDPNARLEIRSLTLPDGTQSELYVVEGENIVVTIDGDRLVGRRIEFDATARVVRVVGPGTFETEQETIQGEDLVFALDDETFRGELVLVVTDAIDVVGDRASRVPGRVSVIGGRFSPCSRCDQRIEDYGFRAERIELYPGDRLVAFEADVLIRGRPVAHVPLLVLPLGPPDRQPRLSIASGTATAPAEIALDWPYVSGGNALGTLSVRYWAQVDPAGPTSPFAPLLGGAVVHDYLGGGIDHRFFTETGAGRFTVFYRPGFVPLNGGEREPPEVQMAFRYATAAELPPPQIVVLVERDDERRDRLVEYTARITDVERGVRATFESQGAIPLREDPEPPSFAGRTTPRQTLLRLEVGPEHLPIREFGVTVDRLRVDLGVFEDVSNVTNRSAAQFPTFRAGRALIDHRVETTQTPWTGFTVRVVNDFVGRYYDTGERLVDWLTDVRATQRFSFGQAELTYVRDINEGETPFRFDQIPLRNRAEARLAVTLQPHPWVSLSSQGGYVFTDTRSPADVGLTEVESRLDLFGPVAWIDLGIENAYDPKTGDLGSLDAILRLQASGLPLRASVTAEHEQDLYPAPPRTGGPAEITTQSRVQAMVGWSDLVAVDASVGYRWFPPDGEEPDGDDELEAPEHWLPLEVGVTVGTLAQEDAIPGVRLSYRRDLNAGETLDVGLEAAFRIGPVHLAARERIDPVAGVVRDSLLEAALPGVVALEARGVVFLPPSVFGFEEDPEAPQRWTVTLRHAPLQGQEIGRLRFTTVLDPTLDAGTFRDSALEGRVRLEERQLGSSRFAVDLFADLKIGDAVAPTTHLRRATLDVAADLFGTVGLQGSVVFRGAFQDATDTWTSAQLTLDDVTVTTRVTEDLFVGARLDDVWNFTAGPEAVNVQPTLFVTWDRCCWALFGSWNTATGQIRIALTAAGSDQGVQQELDTPLVLPGRGQP